jgi:hypothetical protein
MRKTNLVAIAEELTSWRQGITAGTIIEDEVEALYTIADELSTIADTMKKMSSELVDSEDEAEYEMSKDLYHLARYLKK